MKTADYCCFHNLNYNLEGHSKHKFVSRKYRLTSIAQFREIQYNNRAINVNFVETKVDSVVSMLWYSFTLGYTSVCCFFHSGDIGSRKYFYFLF